MKHLATSFILFFSLLAFCQNKEKPIYYIDVDGAIITKKIFIEKKRKPIDNGGYLNIYLENDTCFVSKLIPRKNYGILKENEHLNLLNQIKDNSKKIISYYTLILYHPGKDQCNGGRTFNVHKIPRNIFSTKYVKHLRRKENYSVFWIHQKDSELNFTKKGIIKWQSDKDQYVENMFFKYHYSCNSFVIINNKTREYISVFGESGAPTVLDVVDEMKKSDK
ncbi:hypothetical protein RM697_02190 [Ichthyenterobacterium sp. W332]|uniref:Uncharacterized protein n=1 Tax=Microcosmobacter mediterraneus TaxID=3075607 RepID=A0ABU2YJN1_9FLAO|nr:hypothetical protein [Ichthyenterobacterium sp. W332]MDT0557440.1 hypothetical protein [Ichthyenterobacterium sp. W332]